MEVQVLSRAPIMTATSRDPVPFGYRIGGIFFGLVGAGLLLVAWFVRDAGWVVETGLILAGLGFIFPALGMLFATTHEAAKRAAAWLLLDMLLPH